MDSAPQCPDCGSGGCASLGSLPDVPFFAGKVLAAPLPGGCLWRCRRCDLRFRWPTLPDYERLYDNAKVDSWTTGPLRVDQQLVLQRLHEPATASRVLDFGCYSGGFLARLSPRFEKFGVEVATAAAEVARERTGARVVARLEELDAKLLFDVIVMMDVVEHVPSPLRLLEQLLQRLAPGGRLLLTTGDGGNLLWRLVGGRWWYCYFPEHIAFISARWARYHAARLGCRIDAVERFNYLDGEERKAAASWSRWLRYLMRPAHHARKRGRFLDRHGQDMGVPGIGLTRDHLFVQVSR